ncbi:hypothetical protein F4805DRAFT_476074 [Annulohypoxylon moriforme]|nr:hypothetical protein F4805DRAFT_476074 [Annulohypoxylon moriforme]
MTPKSHETPVMHTVNYGMLTVGQQLLSPNSTGHPHNRRHPLHRCHSHSCRSAPTEQHGKENSREYEDEHWLFSPKPHRFHLRLATSGACSYCKARRTPEDYRNRSLTPERSTGDDLISVWLSGVSCLDCPSEEANLTGQSTPAVAPDLKSKVDGVSYMTYPKIVLQPARRDRSTAQSGTGLDGPQSSESDELSKLRDGLSELKESSRSANLSIGSQKHNSNTSGSFEWDKISNSSFVRRPRTADLPTANNDDGYTNSSSNSESVSNDKSCTYTSQHDAQFHAIKKYALNSCPELHRQLDDFDKTLSTPKERDNQEQIAQLRSELEKVRHRHHFHVRNIVTRPIQSLTRRLRRSGSSTFSVRSEYPARRRRNNIWPSSGEETPLFNTPESNIAHTDTPRAAGHHFDPLAMASMMIATAELDRLSSRASLEQTRTSGSSTGFSGGTPISPTPIHSGVGSPNNEASTPESMTLYSPPTIPHNTPTSSALHSGVVSPLSRPPHRQGHRRRGQRSHLSEVTTPDNIASPEESTEEFTESRSSVSSSLIETLPECSTIPDNVDGDSLYPKPLAIYRNSREETRLTDAATLRDTRDSHLGLKRAGAISAPARVSSIGKTLESVYDLKAIPRDDGQSLPNMSPEPGHIIESQTSFPDLKASSSSMETCDNAEQSPSSNTANDSPALDSDVSQAATIGAFDEDSRPNSCHPDTCISRPLGLVRQDTSETVRSVGVVKKEIVNKGSGLRETREDGD